MKPSNPRSCLWLCALGAGVLVAPAEGVDFNRDIRPILSENCYHCHGPDAEARKADLRLDLAEGAYADREGVRPVVPGDPEKSELVYRVETNDDGDLMPPPKSKRMLTAKQKELLREWVAQGGRYDEHWAFVTPSKAAPPEDVAGRGSNEIDAFVFERLRQEGLSPAEEAERRTLIRRVSLDLTGLPPTPSEVEAFLADPDKSGQAYEKVVDRLLASPRFGERWARPWLDLARYADSNGFQADQLRDSWAYRDWLIDALNADMPFDQFTIEQLAGDLLPNATAEQRIATGFHRTVTCNVEAGVHPEANRTNQVIDRVNTTGTVWLGATMECAQCHDHKYDPFTMKDYYGLFAYFNNTPLEVENPSGKGVSFDFWGPKMELGLPPEKAALRAGLKTELASLRKKRDGMAEHSPEQREAWEEEIRRATVNPPVWEVLPVSDVATNGGEDVRILEDHSILVTGNLPGTAAYTISVETKLENINGFKIEALTHPEIPGEGPGRGDAERTNFILSEFGVVAVEAGAKRARDVELHSARSDFSQTKWEVEKAIDGNQKTGWAIAPKFHEAHWATFLTAEPAGSAKGATFTFTLDQNYGRGRTLGRVRISALVGDATAVDLGEEMIEIVMKDAKKRSRAEKTKLDELYMKSNPEYRKAGLQILRVSKELKTIEPPTTLVMIEMEKSRETHVLMRGEYLNKGEEVDAATPAILPAIDPALPKNRLGLAKWLVDPANPLVARVTVNRWWAQLFGRGIVATLEDFGTQSEPPTHPALLDWLAVEFVESGWSMKHILKLMVMSGTYRQDSRVAPEILERDPTNKLYARGPRFRMSAEMIRDNALAASGLLSTKMHGPPIMPYQPPGLWRQTGRNEPKWIDAKDEDRFRRGIYVVWRRAAPYPSFVNFDGPDRSSCVVSRPRTNTPLQALTLLNDPAYVEMALALAARVMTEVPEGGFDQRLGRAYQILFARAPREEEKAHLAGLFEERLAELRANPDKAKAIVAGEKFAFAPPKGLRDEVLGAWFFVANVLMNLDEAITKG